MTDPTDPHRAQPHEASGEVVEVSCACGWTVRGPLDTVVPETQEHGRRLHNMEASRDDVLAMVRPV